MVEHTGKIVIFFAIDWATDDVIEYAIDQLARYSVKASFYATHESECLKSLDREQYEIGIHPNFDNSTDYDRIIKELKSIYPDSIGVCSHSLHQSSRLLHTFDANGLKYELNTFIPMQQDLAPFWRIRDIMSIPHYWGDDRHFSMHADYDLRSLKLGGRGLKLIGFHPIHVFMNTNSDRHYLEYKPFYKDTVSLKQYRNTEKGIGSLFIDLVNYIHENSVKVQLCREIYEEYLPVRD
jgi:hypothetical protein